MAKTTKDLSFQDKIFGELAISKFDERDLRFLPEGSVNGLYVEGNCKSIIKTLKKGIAGQIKTEGPLIDFIRTEARKLFIICVHINFSGEDLMKAIKLCQGNSISDASLPVGRKILGGLVDQLVSLGDDDYTLSGADFHSDETDEEEEGIWTTSRINDFYEAQWKFIAPVFSLDNVNHDLNGLSVLPFPEVVELAKGSFGKVSRCQIHEAHVVGSRFDTEAVSLAKHYTRRPLKT